MDIVLFGATGMVGQGVLRECLNDPDVKRVVTVGRSATGSHHPKVQELVAEDLADLSAHESQLTGLDACFFCMGVSAGGLTEEQYTRLTYGMATSVGSTLARLNPQMTFVYVSGEGTDSTENGRQMWARVKGRTENALLRMPFKAAYMFRPGIIQPMHGIRSKTKLYDVFYRAVGWLLPLVKRIAPSAVTNTEQVGRAMLAVAKRGAPSTVLNTAAINRL
jgi:uncharacterized protein YbjT (DUF2867 family)